MTYLAAPGWAKHVLRTFYVVIYLMILFNACLLLLPPNPYLSVVIIEGILVMSSILAVYGVLRQSPHWEWVAVFFILGGLSAYIVGNWVDVVVYMNSGGGLSVNLLLEANVATMALLLLTARQVHLTVAVRENQSRIFKRR